MDYYFSVPPPFYSNDTEAGAERRLCDLDAQIAEIGHKFFALPLDPGTTLGAAEMQLLRLCVYLFQQKSESRDDEALICADFFTESE